MSINPKHMKTETNVFLNVQEIGVLLSALQLLDHSDEHHIARHYGPAPVLYNRLHEIYQQMDKSQINNYHQYHIHEHSY
jgi:hypothetical protein|tara:strand:+ start:203 stop:439 length:237 start_codon:yes stop_codon:yes gene_type:complete